MFDRGQNRSGSAGRGQYAQRGGRKRSYDLGPQRSSSINGRCVGVILSQPLNSLAESPTDAIYSGDAVPASTKWWMPRLGGAIAHPHANQLSERMSQ